MTPELMRAQLGGRVSGCYSAGRFELKWMQTSCGAIETSTFMLRRNASRGLPMLAGEPLAPTSEL